MTSPSCEVPVLYATREGQTARIAQHVTEMLRDDGLDSRAFDVQSKEARTLEWDGVKAVVLGGSLHNGRHQRRVLTFARRHVHQLNACRSAFFSVSLSDGSQDPGEMEAAGRLARAFVDTVRWHPQQVVCFAGRLASSRDGWLGRLAMRPLDYEFTDWAAVSRFARDFAADLRRTPEAD